MYENQTFSVLKALEINREVDIISISFFDLQLQYLATTNVGCVEKYWIAVREFRNTHLSGHNPTDPKNEAYPAKLVSEDCQQGKDCVEYQIDSNGDNLRNFGAVMRYLPWFDARANYWAYQCERSQLSGVPANLSQVIRELKALLDAARALRASTAAHTEYPVNGAINPEIRDVGGEAEAEMGVNEKLIGKLVAIFEKVVPKSK